jgi:hypothetical protein
LHHGMPGQRIAALFRSAADFFRFLRMNVNLYNEGDEEVDEPPRFSLRTSRLCVIVDFDCGSRKRSPSCARDSRRLQAKSNPSLTKGSKFAKKTKHGVSKMFGWLLSGRLLSGLFRIVDPHAVPFCRRRAQKLPATPCQRPARAIVHLASERLERRFELRALI